MLCAALAFLIGCTPDYNWREVRENEAGYRVMLPAKPATMSRSIDLDGLRVTMSMTGARVDETSFTVGTVMLPDAAPATREKALAAMRTGMLRNIGGRLTAETAVEIMVVDASGATASNQAGARVQAEGRAHDRSAQMAAEFVARGNRAWQLIVLGPDPDREQTLTFLDSFRIVE